MAYAIRLAYAVSERRTPNTRAICQYSKQHTIRIFSKGDKVSIAVPRLDRTSTDDKRVFWKILDMPKSDRYIIATPYGILDCLYPTNQLLPLDESIEVNISLGNLPKVSLHFVAAKESSSEATMVHCGYKKNCSIRRCKCKKGGSIVLLLVMTKAITAETSLQLLHSQRKDWQNKGVMLEKLMF
jgi:hypothetical protein